MQNFEHRRDRFEAFCRFDNPIINIGMNLSVPDFRPYCKARQIPPFHFFLYCLLHSVRGIDNFMYRILDGEVIKVDRLYGAFTVLNLDNNLNYARFTMSDELDEFIERSVAAGAIARASRALINSGDDLSPRERKNNVYTTCLPWLDMTAIEHPIYRHREADIPLVAWGKFSAPDGPVMRLPFSVQAHHGFVDGYHIHQLGAALSARIAAQLAS
ncbi:MAG: CatA-like O-acetyltransferase [Pseudomonadota bacterium]